MNIQLHTSKEKQLSIRQLSSFFVTACLLANAAFASDSVPRNLNPIKMGNDEETFTFAGRCPNGAPYRIVSYQMEVDGSLQSFYDYQGPAGEGAVRTNASPKKMVVRVCRELADITNGSRYD
jgi:hypothetical protein